MEPVTQGPPASAFGIQLFGNRSNPGLGLQGAVDQGVGLIPGNAAPLEQEHERKQNQDFLHTGHRV
jgi:hypothetical protein